MATACTATRNERDSFALILNLMDGIMSWDYVSVMVNAMKDALKIPFEVSTTLKSLQTALSRHPRIVYVIDGEIGNRENVEFRNALRRYVLTSGGMVMLCGIFSHFFTNYGGNRVFRALDLPWFRSAFTRETQKLRGKFRNTPLPSTIYAKFTYVSNVEPENSLYYSEYMSDHASVAVKKRGDGYVVYIGDGNIKSETIEVMKILSLWDRKSQPLRRAFEFEGRFEKNLVNALRRAEVGEATEDDDDEHSEEEDIFGF